MGAPTDAEVAQASGCTPGAQALLDAIIGKWPGTTSFGCFNKRPVRGGSSWSYHAAGRAIDVHNTSAIMQQIADAMIEVDGVEEVIYNRRIWSLAKKGLGWRPYDGDNPHTDHVHIGVGTDFAGASGGNLNIRVSNLLQVDTILGSGSLYQYIGDFPDPNCEYILAKSQITTPYTEKKQTKVLSTPCSKNEQQGNVFPSFDSDCWDSYTLPELEWKNDLTCYCKPLISDQHCCRWTNSTIYEAEGTFTLKVGAKDIRNFSLSVWTSPFQNLGVPCVDKYEWVDKKPSFSLEVPHLPAGATYRIRPSDHSVIFADRSVEPGNKYTTGRNGGPTGSFVVESCTTAYVLAEFDCKNTATDAKIDIGFSYRYLSSGFV